MPKIEHAMAVARESAAEHDVSLVFNDRLQQSYKVGRVVFQVRILNHDHVTSAFSESASQCCSLALVSFVNDQANVRLATVPLQNMPGAISASIIDQNDLRTDAAAANPPDDLLDRARFVVNGHDHRQQ